MASTAADAAAPVAQTRSSTITGEGAANRLFDLLEPEGQERVVLLKTKYEQLMSLERAAFLQEIGVVSTRDLDAEAERRAKHGKLQIYTNPRLTAVQARDAGFVVLQQDPTAAPDEPPFQDPQAVEAAQATRAATVGMPMSDLGLRRMLTDSLFGEAEVPIRPERVSLYEKIGALEGEEEEAEKEKRRSTAIELEEALRRKSTLVPKPIAPVGEPGNYLYRSNAYQALRLAHSFPGRININSEASAAVTATAGSSGSGKAEEDPALTGATVNVTGIPIYEDELRRWFDAMDTEATGTLDCDAFMGFMRSLDRDFGVASEYEQLERDGQKLALDGKLSFEAFAYLVMRFARA